MSKLLKISLKLGLFLAVITGASTIGFNKNKQQFCTTKLHFALNYFFTVVVILGSFYSYHVNRDYKDTDDSFLKVTKSVYQVTKYMIVILMYSKPWISRQKLLEIFNNSYNLHKKFGCSIEKYKIQSSNLIILLYFAELLQIIVYNILIVILKMYEKKFFVLEETLFIFGSGMRYILNMYFIVIIWHKQLLMALEKRIKCAIDTFMVYSLNANVNTNKNKHIIECIKLCDEFDECYEVFNEIVMSIKSIHKFMLPLLVPEALVLVIDCIATVC